MNQAINRFALNKTDYIFECFIFFYNIGFGKSGDRFYFLDMTLYILDERLLDFYDL